MSARGLHSKPYVWGENIYQSPNEENDDKPGTFLLTKYKSEMDMLIIPKQIS
ncbi:MAG: hypothetical protein H0V30_13770 [Chitinophagaceae bacterium]|nr:hypothetical protein [Chitinophagaceae bacterium]